MNLLTISEVAARLKLSPRTVRNMIAAGIFRLGVHYYRPAGMRPRFDEAALERWVKGEEERPKGITYPLPNRHKAA